MKIIQNGSPKYFRPNGKTFGESDVPFAITILIKFVTDVFNLFTLCSFWIDDGIIVASNTSEANWVDQAETVRQFTAWIFSGLCLKLNEKCDLSPSYEKGWVGCFNSANFVYTKASKILKVSEIFLEIIRSCKITFAQAETLSGKISSLCIQNSSDPCLKILKSILNTVTRLFNEDPTQNCKNDFFFVSQGFADWCISFLNRMASHLHLKSHDLTPTPENRVIICCDASNVGQGLAIYFQNHLIFESAIPLPHSHMLHSNLANLESSSTDNERLTFLQLALKVSKRALSKVFPNPDFFADIRTDSLPLVHQSLCNRLKTPLAMYDMQAIFEFLENWGVAYSINHHSRDDVFASKADANSRIFFPTFTSDAVQTLISFTKKRAYEKLDITELLLNTDEYLASLSYNVLFVPLNLSATLYAKIFPKILKMNPQKSNFLLIPKIKNTLSLFYQNYRFCFEFSAKAYRNSFSDLHSPNFVPLLLFEVCGTDVGVAPTCTKLLHMAKASQKLYRAPDFKTKVLSAAKARELGPDLRNSGSFLATRVNETLCQR